MEVNSVKLRELIGICAKARNALLDFQVAAKIPRFKAAAVVIIFSELLRLDHGVVNTSINEKLLVAVAWRVPLFVLASSMLAYVRGPNGSFLNSCTSWWTSYAAHPKYMVPTAVKTHSVGPRARTRGRLK